MLIRRQTKLNLSNNKIEQTTGSTLNLSGTTIFEQGSTIIIIENSGEGKVLVSDGGGVATWQDIDQISGESVKKQISQTDHGFSVQDVVGFSGSTYNKPIADGTYDGEVLGVVTDVIDSNNFELTQTGYASGFTGLVQGNTYFLSDETEGLLTSTMPDEDGYIVKSLLIADSETSGWVLSYPGYVVSTGETQGITTIENVGEGIGVFDGFDNATANFRSIIGSGDTTVSLSGETIIINTDAIGTITGASNGLSVCDNEIRLGGTLIEESTLISRDVAEETLFRISVRGVDGGSGVYLQSGPNACPQITTRLVVNCTASSMDYTDTTDPQNIENFQFKINSDGAVYCDFQNSGGGIKYCGDYSSSYTPRSLVDKEYVDNAVTGITTVTTFTGLTDTPNNYVSENYIRVNAGGDELEYRTPAEVLSDIGAIDCIDHVHCIANAVGTNQFSFGVEEHIRFEGSGATTISFTSGTNKVTITSTDTNYWGEHTNGICYDGNVGIGTDPLTTDALNVSGNIRTDGDYSIGTNTVIDSSLDHCGRDFYSSRNVIVCNIACIDTMYLGADTFYTSNTTGLFEAIAQGYTIAGFNENSYIMQYGQIPGTTNEGMFIVPVNVAASTTCVGIRTCTPTHTLDVDGKIRMREETQNTDGNDVVATKGYVDVQAGGLWSCHTNGICYNGNVGINTNPVTTDGLNVCGNIRTDSNYRIGTNTVISSALDHCGRDGDFSRDVWVGNNVLINTASPDTQFMDKGIEITPGSRGNFGMLLNDPTTEERAFGFYVNNSGSGELYGYDNSNANQVGFFLKADGRSYFRENLMLGSNDTPTQQLDVDGLIRMRNETTAFHDSDTVATKGYVDACAGGVQGSGTAGRAARWTASNCLGNSAICDTGLCIAIGSDIVTGHRIYAQQSGPSTIACSTIFGCNTFASTAGLAAVGGESGNGGVGKGYLATFRNNIRAGVYGCAGTGQNCYGGYFEGNVYIDGGVEATGDVCAFVTSDERLKENVQSLSNSVCLIGQLNPVSFNWNEEAKKLSQAKRDGVDFGLIAQETEKVIPEIVHDMYKGKYKGVDYPKLIPFLVSAINEQQKTIESLNNKIEEILNKIK